MTSQFINILVQSWLPRVCLQVTQVKVCLLSLANLSKASAVSSAQQPWRCLTGARCCWTWRPCPTRRSRDWGLWWRNTGDEPARWSTDRWWHWATTLDGARRLWSCKNNQKLPQRTSVLCSVAEKIKKDYLQLLNKLCGCFLFFYLGSFLVLSPMEITLVSRLIHQRCKICKISSK